MNPILPLVLTNKSRLFNRLAGKRISIVHDRPGVTRDVVAADSQEGYADGYRRYRHASRDDTC